MTHVRAVLLALVAVALPAQAAPSDSTDTAPLRVGTDSTEAATLSAATDSTDAARLLAATDASTDGTQRVETDSTDALDWARRVVRARRAVAAAEDELDPERRADLAEVAYRDVRSVAATGSAGSSLRKLVLRAQAVYEAQHGPAVGDPLAPDEMAELRGPLLASLGPNYAPPLRDPAVVAAERAAAAEAARAAAAEAERAAGPDWLFYPASAEPLVERQRRFARGLSRSGRRNRSLLRQISRTLSRRGVPTDLQYVAVIESSLNLEAESHAGARGLWQFMPATAEEYGLDSLTVTQVGPSTNAAARYLRWLAGRFDGDWHLALAAYNCGIGRVQRIVREHRQELGRTPTFWDIHDALPRETQHYVPRFIAVAEAMGARG